MTSAFTAKYKSAGSYSEKFIYKLSTNRVSLHIDIASFGSLIAEKGQKQTNQVVYPASSTMKLFLSSFFQGTYKSQQPGNKYANNVER